MIRQTIEKLLPQKILKIDTANDSYCCYTDIVKPLFENRIRNFNDLPLLLSMDILLKTILFSLWILDDTQKEVL